MLKKPWTSWVGFLNHFFLIWTPIRLARVTPSADDNTTIGLVVLYWTRPGSWALEGTRIFTLWRKTVGPPS
jgi:hypothetical protein